MTPEELNKAMREGNDKVIPYVEKMTDILMEVYRLGYENALGMIEKIMSDKHNTNGHR